MELNYNVIKQYLNTLGIKTRDCKLFITIEKNGQDNEWLEKTYKEISKKFSKNDISFNDLSEGNEFICIRK